MPDATFARPDLTSFCRLVELGLEVLGQHLEPDHAPLSCRVAEPDQWCRRCGCEGSPRDSVTRRLAHEPLGWRPAVMDPLHVVRLAGDALDRCRRRVQHDLHGHRGRRHDPLYRARRALHTGDDLLTDQQHQRLRALFAVAEHVQVEATWGIYQRMIGAYRDPNRGYPRIPRVFVALELPTWV